MKGKSSALSLVIALATIFAVLISAQEHKSAVRIPHCEHPHLSSVRMPCEEPPLNLPECARCSRSRNCVQGKCWGSPSRCTDGSYPSLKRCFKDECEHCTASGQCATKKCWGPGAVLKCTFDTMESKRKCFPGWQPR